MVALSQTPVESITTLKQDAPLEEATRQIGSHEHPVLLRLPFSHYCRKAEWGLTLAGIDYVTLDVDLPGMRQVKRANPLQRTVPVLVHGKDLVHGSHAILRWCDAQRTDDFPALYPESNKKAIFEWEKWVDDEVGPVVRRLAYRVLARDPAVYGRTRWQKFNLRMRRPMFKVVARYLKCNEHAKQDDEAIQRIVDKIATRLNKAQTGYLFDDKPTGADIATAALVEPLLRVDKVWLLDEHPGWSQVKEFIQKVKPPKQRRISARRIKEKDWKAFELLNQAYGTLHRPTAAEYD
jgi:glutathione S-transferase